MCNQQSLRSACACAQVNLSLCQSLECSMSVKLLAEHHLEFLSLTGGCTSLSKPTLVKIPHRWKSHVQLKWFGPRSGQKFCPSRSGSACAQVNLSLCQSLECSMSVKLLAEHHLEFLSLTGGCTSLSKPTLVKIPHRWKSHVQLKWFGPRSGQKFCPSRSGSKVFAKIIIRQQKWPLARKEFRKGSYKSAHVLLNL